VPQRWISDRQVSVVAAKFIHPDRNRHFQRGTMQQHPLEHRTPHFMPHQAVTRLILVEQEKEENLTIVSRLISHSAI
jgi:hypothetical protein